jgi:hypothetical protein
MKLASDVLKAVKSQHSDIKLSTQKLILKCCNEIIDDCERKLQPAISNMGLENWLRSDDTGASSLYMAHIICQGPYAPYAHPYDSADFGRCYRFLKAVNRSSTILAIMCATSTQWDALVNIWNQLETMYENKQFLNISRTIQETLEKIK